MSNSRIPSPARSQGVISTPRKRVRRTQSVCSPARTNIRLSSIIESYKVSPVPDHQSVLNDDTDIDMPRRLSWWKKIDDNSRDVFKLLERKELLEVNNVAEEFDVEVLSQENKNYALDLPDSSDGESINSIVIPQRKLFTQKDNQIKFRQIKNNRETLQKLNKSYVDQDKELNVGRKTLFSQPSKPRTKPVFPAALLDISANKTVNKTKEIPAAEVKGQVRSLFGGRPGTKRKNMFTDFIASESEDEISEIQPKVFGFQKRNEPKRRASSMSRHSTTSSVDLELDDWRLLPSSTMVENHIDEATSPVKRIKLSNLVETNDSEKSDSNNTLNKTKQANKSVISKNKSKNLSNTHHENDKSNDINITPRNASSNKSRVTRSMGKSIRKNSVTSPDISKNLNKTKNQTQSNQDRSELKTSKTIKNVSHKDRDIVKENQNMLIDHPDPDEDFTLEHDNDDNEVAIEKGKNYNKNPKNKTASNLNIDDVEDKNNLVKQSSEKKNEEHVIEQEISTNNICENQEKLLENKQNNIGSSKVSNYSEIQNNSQEVRNVVGQNNDSTFVQTLKKSIDKNKSKSIKKSVEKCIEGKDMQKESSSKEQSFDKGVEDNEKLGKSIYNLNEENRDDQENESENELNENDNYHEHQSDKQEEANESTKEENNDSETEEEINDSETEEEINEDEQQENESQTENVSEERTDNEEQEIINESNTDERDKEMILDDQRDNIEDKNQVTLPNISHDTTGRHRKKNKSPEVILHDKTKGIDSFTVQARNTSVRKTKSIIFHNKLDTVTDSRRSTGFSDATCNSSAEGSGWDSHRTTRKTLRQTFGKDFTPRKSLRALVMEKTAKLQANNFTGVVDNFKTPRANSTEYEQAQNELDSYQETELVQVEQNIVMVQVDEKNAATQIEKDVTERLEKRDKTDQLEGGNKTEQLEERNKVDQSKTVEKDETKVAEVSAETEQSEDKDESKHSVERDEMDLDQSGNGEKDETEPFEEREQTEIIERNDTEHFEEREEIEESGEREEVEESEEREEVEESEEREEVEESEEREEVEESEEREEVEESEEGEEMEESEVGEEVEESEGEEMEESEEKEEMEESEEKEDLELSEEREEMEQFEERDDMDQSKNEEREETEQFEEKDEMEQSEDETEQFEERFEMEQSQDETEQFEERDDTVPEDEIIASDHVVSKQTRQTSLETYLQKIQQDNAEKRRKMQEELRKSLKNPKRDDFNLFKVPQRPAQRIIKIQKPKAKQRKTVIPLEMLPSEVIEDMKYKPPKRFQPNNASWITKRLYKFLENKLELKYDYKARIRAEKLVQCMYNFTKEVRRHDSVRSEAIEELKRGMARLDIVKTHFDFYEFCHEFFPREIRIKVVPDIVNNIQLPRRNVFSDILRQS